MTVRYDDRVRVAKPGDKRDGQIGLVIEISDWTATVAFDDRATLLYGLRYLSEAESPPPVVG